LSEHSGIRLVLTRKLKTAYQQCDSARSDNNKDINRRKYQPS
jgi:hypothetical protein